jgi:hypothetical protein
MLNGKFEGIVRVWARPHSKRPNELPYHNGQPHGEWTYYFENGQINHRYVYENGRLVYRRGDDIDIFMEKMADMMKTESGCSGSYPHYMSYPRKRFLEVFGEPASNISLPEGRRWTYRCRDGEAYLVIVESDRINVMSSIDYRGRRNEITPNLAKAEVMAKLRASGGGQGGTQLYFFGLFCKACG